MVVAPGNLDLLFLSFGSSGAFSSVLSWFKAKEVNFRMKSKIGYDTGRNFSKISMIIWATQLAWIGSSRVILASRSSIFRAEF